MGESWANRDDSGEDISVVEDDGVLGRAAGYAPARYGPNAAADISKDRVPRAIPSWWASRRTGEAVIMLGSMWM